MKIYELLIVAALGLGAGYQMGAKAPQTVTFQKAETYQELRDAAGNVCRTLGTTSLGHNQIKQDIKCGSKQLQLVKSYFTVDYDNNQDVAR